MEESFEGPQSKGEIVVETNTEKFVLVGRPCELSAFSHVPSRRGAPRERTYFNVEKHREVAEPTSTYDQLYHQDFGFDNKLHRCDRKHAKSRGLHVNKEENTKDIPTLSSSIYGHRLDSAIDKSDRKHARIAAVKAEFYRRNDINIKPIPGS